MRLVILGGCGAWPDAGQACSGYLLEHDGFRLLIDPGYAIVPRLLELTQADRIDAVFISHGHPDHCVDLNPLLRARVVRDHPPPAPPLPVYAPPDSLDTVLALDRFASMRTAAELHEFTPGSSLHIGPFSAETRLLPHSLPNAGIRLTADGQTLMYTGDAGPTDDTIELARDADLMLAEASYVDEVLEDNRGTLGSARQVGEQARAAGVGQLVLTHLMPGTDSAASTAAAAAAYGGPIAVATGGLVREF